MRLSPSPAARRFGVLKSCVDVRPEVVDKGIQIFAPTQHVAADRIKLAKVIGTTSESCFIDLTREFADRILEFVAHALQLAP
jgi:hypothetical protein